MSKDSPIENEEEEETKKKLGKKKILTLSNYWICLKSTAITSMEFMERVFLEGRSNYKVKFRCRSWQRILLDSY